MSRDLRTALRTVWLIVTLVTSASALAPFVLSESTIAGVAPVCESKKSGADCWMCGTTTAFIAISRADWPAAAAANRTAIPLFAAFILNAAIAAVHLSSSLRKNASGR